MTVALAAGGPGAGRSTDLLHAGRPPGWTFKPLRCYAFVATMHPATHGEPDQPILARDAGWMFPDIGRFAAQPLVRTGHAVLPWTPERTPHPTRYSPG